MSVEARKRQKTTDGALKKAVERIAPLAETSRDLVKQADLLYKLACRLTEQLPSPAGRGAGGEGAGLSKTALIRQLRDIDKKRQLAVEQLKLVRYFHR